MGTSGALLLTAGFGTRAEPLSLVRPKCLLPWGETTVLGFLAERAAALDPGLIALNASRCPELVLSALDQVWPRDRCRLYFEERPLGTAATLSRHCGLLSSGTWMLGNTDMVIPELDLHAMLRRHRESGAAWTALTGVLPAGGDYRPLHADRCGRFGHGGETGTHYLGISFIEPSVSRLAMETQCSGGLFTELAPLAAGKCGDLLVFHHEGRWLDMGRMERLRENILSGGSFVHPTACISSDAVLSGSYHIGRGCMLGGGTELHDSVMLEGSTLESGRLESTILSWYCSSPEGKPR
ncbi:MAG: hypothetical protein AVO35_11435 [Candidatus Aegiribacteria sp. MLS_C]|nr:MAG: hypothetical protein AVO35_11435 [Candidatus Aegiribacteria sp. MLS_C]